MTQIVTSAQSTAQTGQASQAADQLKVDYQNFLKLLTAQISNQDPLAPMESTEFVSQLAQLTQVEQSIQTNSNLEAISAAMSLNSSKIDLGLLDHDVVVPGNQIERRPDGARFFYELSDQAAQVKVLVRDSSGSVIRELSAPSGVAGTRIEMTWDGLDASGQPVVDGIYTVDVSAVTEDQTSIAASTYVVTGVSGIAFDASGTVMTLANGRTDTPSNVVEVR